jgi:dolichol-phosphate mannosyltransferase
MSVEIIFIDDGSSDNSAHFIREKCTTDNRYKLICLSRNFGHQAAILAGLNVSLGDAVIAMDADLQDPPELIPTMIREWMSGSEVVYAKRKERKGDSLFKRTSANFFYFLIDWLSDTKLPRNVGDFRLMDRIIVNQVKNLPEKSLYLRGMVSWIGFKQTAVEFDRDARFAGSTKYTISKMVNLAVDALLSFSERPLRVVTRLGLLMTLFSFSAIVFLLFSVLFESFHGTAGWLSIIATVLLLGGVQLVCLGIVGEYVSRIYRETKGRPLFIIDEKRSTR